MVSRQVYFFISVRGRRQPVIPFEQTFMGYVIDDSYNESYKSQPEVEGKMNRVLQFIDSSANSLLRRWQKVIFLR